jgi:hypothetical protein
MPTEFAYHEPPVKPDEMGDVHEPRTDGVLPTDVARKIAKGTAYRIDDKWRMDIERAMEEQGITQAELRRRIGCSKGALSDALSLKVGKPSSKWVPAIHAILGFAPPSSTVEAVVPGESSTPSAPERPRVSTDPRRAFLHQAIDQMTEEQLEKWIAEILTPPAKRGS